MLKSEAKKLNRLLAKALNAVADLRDALIDGEGSLESILRAEEAHKELSGIGAFEADEEA